MSLVVADKFEILVDLSPKGEDVIVAVFGADEVFELEELGLVEVAVLALLAKNGIDVVYDQLASVEVVTVSFHVFLK